MDSELFDQIDELTRKQQIKDLLFLLKHHQDLNELGIQDVLIVTLFNQGLLKLTLKEMLDEVRKDFLR